MSEPNTIKFFSFLDYLCLIYLIIIMYIEILIIMEKRNDNLIQKVIFPYSIFIACELF